MYTYTHTHTHVPLHGREKLLLDQAVLVDCREGWRGGGRGRKVIVSMYMVR